MALITVADLKTYLGITSASEDTFLALLVSGVDAAVKRYLNREIESATYTGEVYDGSGGMSLFLEEFPVTAISEVKVSDDFFGGYDNTTGAFESANLVWVRNTDYIVRRLDESERNVGELISTRGVWPEGVANVRVTYTAGYTTVPQAIQQACFLICKELRQSRDASGNLKSETLGDYSYTVLSSADEGGASIATAKSLLGPYRKMMG